MSEELKISKEEASKIKKRLSQLSLIDLLEEIKEIPILVKFSAAWCPPCVLLKETIDSFKKEREEKGKAIHCIEIDVDKHSRLAELFEITSLPTTYLFYKKNIYRKVGNMSISQLENFVEGPSVE